MPDAARQIENLVYSYAMLIDSGDLSGLADLFAHGCIQAGSESDARRFTGRDAVAALYESSVRILADGTPGTKHVTTNVVIDVDAAAGAATAESYYTVTQATSDLPLQVIITGRYLDTFHLVEGAWWFDTRIMIVDQIGDLSRHLRYELE